MATGDPMCPTCGQYKMNCACGRVLASMTSGYMQRADAPPNPPFVFTTTAKPGDPTLWTYPDMLPQTWGVTTTTTTTYKRKRRHYRQVVY